MDKQRDVRIPLFANVMLQLVGLALSVGLAYELQRRIMTTQRKMSYDGPTQIEAMLDPTLSIFFSYSLAVGAPLIATLFVSSGVNWLASKKFRPFDRVSFFSLSSIAMAGSFVFLIVLLCSYTSMGEMERFPLYHLIGGIVMGLAFALLLGFILRSLGFAAPSWVRFALPLLVVPIVFVIEASKLIYSLTDAVGYGAVLYNPVLWLALGSAYAGSFFAAFLFEAIEKA